MRQPHNKSDRSEEAEEQSRTQSHKKSLGTACKLLIQTATFAAKTTAFLEIFMCIAMVHVISSQNCVMSVHASCVLDV